MDTYKDALELDRAVRGGRPAHGCPDRRTRASSPVRPASSARTSCAGSSPTAPTSTRSRARCRRCTRTRLLDLQRRASRCTRATSPTASAMDAVVERRRPDARLPPRRVHARRQVVAARRRVHPGQRPGHGQPAPGARRHRLRAVRLHRHERDLRRHRRAVPRGRGREPDLAVLGEQVRRRALLPHVPPGLRLADRDGATVQRLRPVADARPRHPRDHRARRSAGEELQDDPGQPDPRVQLRRGPRRRLRPARRPSTGIEGELFNLGCGEEVADPRPRDDASSTSWATRSSRSSARCPTGRPRSGGCSATAPRRASGWAGSRATRLADGLAKTIDWYRAQHDSAQHAQFFSAPAGRDAP